MSVVRYGIQLDNARQFLSLEHIHVEFVFLLPQARNRNPDEFYYKMITEKLKVWLIV